MSSVLHNYNTIVSALPVGVKLVAISKTKPDVDILQVYNAGHRIFGENKVQELIAKAPRLPSDIEWHMVGHLQTNKVKYIAPFISMIQSVDSLKLLEVINKEGAKCNRVIDCLLQIHVAEEETKFGLSEVEASELLSDSEIHNYKNVKICGLMGMATFTDDTIQVRREFHGLAELFKKQKEAFFKEKDYFREISMGMSDDYKLALEEGATIIRIGSLIFGERNFL